MSNHTPTICDETELTAVLVVNQRAYTVPRDVKNAHDELVAREASYKQTAKIMDENFAILEAQRDELVAALRSIAVCEFDSPELAGIARAALAKVAA